jgi:DNA invertase Pin-like site-specific DNA recombinase
MSGRTWGYARVSDDAQSLNLQLDALRSVGIAEEMIFTDYASGARASRNGLNRLLEMISPHDHIVVWRLDRLGRSVAHLASLLELLNERHVTFRSLTEAIDTQTPSGRMLYSVMASLSAYERELVVERVRAGMSAAARRGVHLGRPSRLSLPQREHAAGLRAAGQSYKQIAALFRVHPSTIYRAVLNVQTAA